MTIKQRSHIEAAIGTVLAMVLLFLLLWFITMAVSVEVEDEGIEVAFGVTEEGGGYQPQQSESAPSISAAPAPAASAPTHNDLMTQDDEESLTLQRQREEDARRKAEQAELIRQQREAEARAEAERIAKEQALAEQRAKEQQTADNTNKFVSSLFGNNGSTATGSGDSQGDGRKGNPVGHGSSGGATWSLSGRGVKDIPEPLENYQEAGKVVVDIIVDAAGNVVSAKAGATGTNTSSPTLLRIAEEAARKAKFTSSSDKPQQRGTITYNFVLN